MFSVIELGHGAVQRGVFRWSTVSDFSVVSAFVFVFSVSVAWNLCVDGQQSTDDRFQLPAGHFHGTGAICHVTTAWPGFRKYAAAAAAAADTAADVVGWKTSFSL